MREKGKEGLNLENLDENYGAEIYWVEFWERGGRDGVKIKILKWIKMGKKIKLITISLDDINVNVLRKKKEVKH